MFSLSGSEQQESETIMMSKFRDAAAVAPALDGVDDPCNDEIQSLQTDKGEEKVEEAKAETAVQPSHVHRKVLVGTAVLTSLLLGGVAVERYLGRKLSDGVLCHYKYPDGLSGMDVAEYDVESWNRADYRVCVDNDGGVKTTMYDQDGRKSSFENLPPDVIKPKRGTCVVGCDYSPNFQYCDVDRPDGNYELCKDDGTVNLAYLAGEGYAGQDCPSFFILSEAKTDFDNGYEQAKQFCEDVNDGDNSE